MKILVSVVLLLAALVPITVDAQRLRDREIEFLDQKPLVGQVIPDVEVYTPEGDTFSTADLRGHYTVLTFGCLTCPPSMWSIPKLEAVHQDYKSKGVKFYFIYKALAHPELAGNYVQPFTQDERLMQARQASKQLGTKIPWIVDAIDNRLKHALGDRPNSQFILDPDGVIISKSAWSNPDAVRSTLEDLVGPSETLTAPVDLQLVQIPALANNAPRGVAERVRRTDMVPIRFVPEASEQKYFAKLRVEADPTLLASGRGNLYVGFHLDPLHNAHWNNLTEPLTFNFMTPGNVVINPSAYTAERIDSPIDSDPREFIVPVGDWPRSEPIQLSVVYYACEEQTCHAVKQSYAIYLERDRDGGGARGAGAGFWDEGEFTLRLLDSDSNGDGMLSKSESPGLILPHFEKIDINSDGMLDKKELGAVTGWLNQHHQAGPPAR